HTCATPYNYLALDNNSSSPSTPSLHDALPISFGPGEGGQVVAFTQDRWALQDNLSWTAGRHALKVGGSVNYGILYRNWDLDAVVDRKSTRLNSSHQIISSAVFCLNKRYTRLDR